MKWFGRKLCGQGFHSWRLLEMYDVRMVSVVPYSANICTMIESCRREGCGLRRTRKNAELPRRVRT